MKASLRFKILARDGFRCRYCGATAHEARLHVDHIHPKSRGGADCEDNLVTACLTCNLGKSARLIPAPQGIPLTDLISRLGPYLEEYHDGWKRGYHGPDFGPGKKIRQIGIALYEFAGTAGMDSAFEAIEDEYIDQVAYHLEPLWDGVGSWAY